MPASQALPGTQLPQGSALRACLRPVHNGRRGRSLAEVRSPAEPGTEFLIIGVHEANRMTVTDDRLEEAFLAYLKEAETGHAPDRAEFLARYPELASELAEYLTVEQRVDTLFPRMREIFGVSAAPALSSFGDYEVLAPIGVGGMG